MLKQALLILGTAAAIAGCQSTKDLGGMDSPSASMQDNLFFSATAESNQMEIQESQMAQSMSQNQQVKQFAQKMIDDHTKAGNDLKQLATSKGAMLPTRLDDMHQDMVDKLQKTNGTDFDKCYADQQVKAHEMTIAEVQKEADSGTDSDIKMAARNLIPTLKMHLQMAADLQNSLVGTNNNGMAPMSGGTPNGTGQGANGAGAAPSGTGGTPAGPPDSMNGPGATPMH